MQNQFGTLHDIKQSLITRKSTQKRYSAAAHRNSQLRYSRIRGQNLQSRMRNSLKSVYSDVSGQRDELEEIRERQSDISS